MKIVVFSDLDGTLLDHSTYSYAPACPALDMLSKRKIPLVLASSKTAAEIAPLHQALGLGSAPTIIENGAGVFDPNQRGKSDRANYIAIRAKLGEMTDNPRQTYEGFGDMSPARVSELTGLSLFAAQLAQDRCFSEPGLWHGSDANKESFLKDLSCAGITARQGGRFLTLSYGKTKADAMQEVCHRLGADYTIALGDAPNDLEMLAAADHAVIIRNDHGPEISDIPGNKTVTRTSEPGPMGWNSAVLSIVNQLHAQEGIS